MTKLLLTILLTLSFSLFASNKSDSYKGDLILKKIDVSKTFISQNLNQKNYSTCEDECYIEFDDCTWGLPSQGIEYEYCEGALDSCLDFCEYQK